MELKDVLHFYIGCECIVSNKIDSVVCKVINVSYNGTGAYCSGKTKDGRLFNYYGISNIKPILRPLSDMTEEEAIKLCSVYSPEAFGDYRFSKWVAVRDEANFCYNVTNKKSDMSFSVDIEEMHIKVYEGGSDTYPSIEKHTYFTEYLCMGFDIFGLISKNLAIDKTKLNP